MDILRTGTGSVCRQILIARVAPVPRGVVRRDRLHTGAVLSARMLHFRRQSRAQ
jgi:hypothetical protein